MFEENIDEKRVITDTNILQEELICRICYYILWKPRICASCQNLMCQKCILKCLSPNQNLCPFCRLKFKEKFVASSRILSLLSNLRIRCCNSSNGCTKILPYDLLEQHESFECKYISKKCHRCEQLVLIENINQHENICKPILIKCSICKALVESQFIHSHKDECLQERSNEMIEHQPSILSMNRFRQENYFFLLWTLFKLILFKPSMIHLVILKFFIFDTLSFDMKHRYEVSIEYNNISDR
ncbi:unnamed protein product [Rotaria sp. Silwood2]|nr:unnamed protein product [Rotaria sp. Silwood2]